MFAYLDNTGLVVGTSKKQRTLDEARVKNPNISEVILDAPTSVRAFGHGIITYTKVSGDGSDLSHYETGENLTEIKKKKKSEVDERTRSLILSPFSFDGVLFSMSLEAQSNWTQLTVLTQMGVIAWPYNLSTYGDGEYSMTMANFPLFVSAMTTHKTSAINSGRALVMSIDATTTLSDMDAITDNR